MTMFSGLATSLQAAPLPAAIPSPPRGVWEIGPIPIRAYALCIIIGIIVAGIWGNRRLVARGGRPGAITDLAVWMIPFGIVGGRLYHVITDPELYFCGDGCNPWNVFAIWNGGLGIWGAIALGGLGGYLGARRYKIAFGAVADALAPGIVLAQGIGRIGNYFNQELFGSPTGVPWGLDVYLRTPGGIAGDAGQCTIGGNTTGEFPTEWIKSSSDILCGTYHPTFAYELLWDVLIALVVVWADRRFRLGHGRAFALYVAGYTAGRAWIEMLRIDHANHFLGLRLNVFVALAVFIAAVVYLVVTRGRGREDPATVRGIVPGRARSGDGPDDDPVGSTGDDSEAHSGAGPDGDTEPDGDTRPDGHAGSDGDTRRDGDTRPDGHAGSDGDTRSDGHAGSTAHRGDGSPGGTGDASA